MKKIYAIIIVVFVVCSFVGCKSSKEPIHWTFAYSVNQVTKIEIVAYTAYDDQNDNRLVVKNIDLRYLEELYSDIQMLDYYQYALRTEPSDHFGCCFQITFDNGEYDVLDDHMPSHHFTDPESGKPNSSFIWAYCSSKAFDQLIEKYMHVDDETEKKLYSEDAFGFLEVGKTTYNTVYEVLKPEKVVIDRTYVICTYPLENGSHMVVQYTGKDSVVYSMEKKQSE